MADHENGIELKVMRGDTYRSSVDHAINEISGENSMLSMENVNSIIGIKCTIHLFIYFIKNFLYFRFKGRCASQKQFRINRINVICSKFAIKQLSATGSAIID